MHTAGRQLATHELGQGVRQRVLECKQRVALVQIAAEANALGVRVQAVVLGQLAEALETCRLIAQIDAVPVARVVDNVTPSSTNSDVKNDKSIPNKTNITYTRFE